jgi:hypothetical protein
VNLPAIIVDPPPARKMSCRVQGSKRTLAQASVSGAGARVPVKTGTAKVAFATFACILSAFAATRGRYDGVQVAQKSVVSPWVIVPPGPTTCAYQVPFSAEMQ